MGITALALACNGVGSVDAVDGDPTDLDREQVDGLPVFSGNLVLEPTYAISERDGLAVGVVVHNLGPEALVGKKGGPGSWWFEAFDNPDRAGLAAWSGSARHGRQGLLPVDIPPGASQGLGGGGLGLIGNVPAGTYYFRASLVLQEPTMRTAFLPAGRVEIPK